MNFEDSLKVCAKVFNPGYLEIGGRCYYMNDDGSINFDDNENEPHDTIDENGDSLQPVGIRYIDFGKCILLPNSRANFITLLDGQRYVNSYEVIAPLNKKRYRLLPKEGDKVWIAKKDGTIDREMEVKGFVTLKSRYLKLWL